MDSSFVFLVVCPLVSLFADPKKKRHVVNVARDAAKGYIQLVWHKKYCLQLQGVLFLASQKLRQKVCGKIVK